MLNRNAISPQPNTSFLFYSGTGVKALDVTRITPVADQLPDDVPLLRQHPFRAPHHTTSHAGLGGSGNWLPSSEFPLAHRSILFLNEFPEFGSRVLEVMRQSIEDKVVTLCRA